MSLFHKPYTLRRFKPSVIIKGHSTSMYEEKTLLADVQTLQNISSTLDSGAESKQRLKVFSKEQIQLADKPKGIRADWLYFQGKWFEAVACRLSENTLLKHYTSEFEEIPNAEHPGYLQPPAPINEEESKEEVKNENEEVDS